MASRGGPWPGRGRTQAPQKEISVLPRAASPPPSEEPSSPQRRGKRDPGRESQTLPLSLCLTAHQLVKPQVLGPGNRGQAGAEASDLSPVKWAVGKRVTWSSQGATAQSLLQGVWPEVSGLK